MLYRLYSYGITENTSLHEAKRIKIINMLACISFALMLINNTAAFFEGNLFILNLNIIRLLVFIGLFTIIYFKQHTFATYYFVSSSLILNIYGGYSNPQQNVLIYSVFPIMALCLYLIDNLIWNICYCAASYLGFTFLISHQSNQTEHFNITTVIGILVIFSAFVLIYYFVKKENIKFEKLIEEQNKTLACANLQLEKQNKNLNALNNVKDKLFKIIAHDLRNPFQAINGVSEILIKEFDTLNDTDKQEFINNIKSTSNTGYYILDNLLKWSINQTNVLTARKETCNLHQLTQEAVSIFTEQIQSKKINLQNTIAENLLINADKNMFASILRNLISNAVKFTPLNGNILISSVEETSNILFSIQDNGIGIAPEQIAAMLNNESISSTNGTTNEEGTGIGLYLCKDFIHKHQGELKIQSNIGAGSIFSFNIPKIQD